MRTWIDAALTFARARRLPEAAVDRLRVFEGQGSTAWNASFEALEAGLSPQSEVLAQRVARELSTAVDAHQAQVFAGRFRALDALLARDGRDEARLLRVGLSQRLSQILDEGGDTRPLRVRAVIDYVYSQAALLKHLGPTSSPPSLVELVRGARWRDVADGIELGRLEGLTPYGPQHIHVLRCAPDAVDLEAIDAWAAWGSGDPSPHLQTCGAVATFSGGFFLYSEADPGPHSARHEPVGLLVRQARVERPAIFARGALVQRGGGKIVLDRVGLDAHTLSIDGGPWRVPGPYRTRAHGRRASGVAIVGSRVVDRGEDIPIPLNGVVLSGRDGPVGASVRWRLPGVQTALSGGPMLVVDGRVHIDLLAEDFRGSAPPQTFVGDETGDRNLLPRLAVGLTARGDFLVVAVDGRHLERALGLGLHALGELLVALGAVRGLNLDGGSSKRLLIGTEAVDLPSAGIQGEGVETVAARPLHTAVLVHARG